MIDPIKDNFIQPLSIKEILDELKFFKDDCYRALSILKDEDLELRLKRQRISCFVNNYFDIGLFLIMRQWHICVNSSQNLRIKVHKQ